MVQRINACDPHRSSSFSASFCMNPICGHVASEHPLLIYATVAVNLQGHPTLAKLAPSKGAPWSAVLNSKTVEALKRTEIQSAVVDALRQVMLSHKWGKDSRAVTIDFISGLSNVTRSSYYNVRIALNSSADLFAVAESPLSLSNPHDLISRLSINIDPKSPFAANAICCVHCGQRGHKSSACPTFKYAIQVVTARPTCDLRSLEKVRAHLATSAQIPLEHLTLKLGSTAARGNFRSRVWLFMCQNEKERALIAHLLPEIFDPRYLIDVRAIDAPPSASCTVCGLIHARDSGMCPLKPFLTNTSPLSQKGFAARPRPMRKARVAPARAKTANAAVAKAAEVTEAAAKAADAAKAAEVAEARALVAAVEAAEAAKFADAEAADVAEANAVLAAVEAAEAAKAAELARAAKTSKKARATVVAPPIPVFNSFSRLSFEADEPAELTPRPSSTGDELDVKHNESDVNHVADVNSAASVLAASSDVLTPDDPDETVPASPPLLSQDATPPASRASSALSAPRRLSNHSAIRPASGLRAPSSQTLVSQNVTVRRKANAKPQGKQMH